MKEAYYNMFCKELTSKEGEDIEKFKSYKKGLIRHNFSLLNYKKINKIREYDYLYVKYFLFFILNVSENPFLQVGVVQPERVYYKL